MIDLDRFNHDLIGSGSPAADGTFNLSFGRQEFNLDRFEDEDWPELWIVICRVTDGGSVPVESFGLPRSRWVGTTIDVGRIELDPHLLELPEVEEVPSADRGSRDTVSLSEASLRELAESVRPEVEELTGWSLDLSELRFTTDFNMVDLCGPADAAESAIVRQVSSIFFRIYSRSRILAAYGPASRSIAVNPRCARLPSETMQVVLGHELVHFGQFQEVPHLYDRVLAAVEKMEIELDAAFASGECELGQIFSSSGPASDLTRIKVAIEGQATWVDRALQSQRPLASVPTLEPSLPGRLLTIALSRFGFGIDEVELWLSSHYRDGLQWARGASERGRPLALPEWLTSPI